jgi:hypothetical protein
LTYQRLDVSKGIDPLATKLVSVIKKTLDDEVVARRKKRGIYSSVFASLALLLSLLSMKLVETFYPSPSDDFIRQTIEQRIDILNDKIAKDQSLTFQNSKQSEAAKVNAVFTDFMKLKSSYRNFYEFTNGEITIDSKKNVEHALGVDVDHLAPSNNYDLQDPIIYFTADSVSNHLRRGIYWYKNGNPITYTIVRGRSLPDERYEVVVEFHENIRVFAVTLSFPREDDTRRRDVVISGFLPQEKLVFSKTDGSWSLENSD